MYVPPPHPPHPPTGGGDPPAPPAWMPSALAAVDADDPDRLAAVLAEAMAGLGVTATALYLADYGETALVPVAPGGDGPAGPRARAVPLPGPDEPATPASRAYVEQVVVADTDGASRLWAPVQERGRSVGVLELHAATLHPTLRDAALDAGRLVAHLVTSGGRYTDALHVARRRRELSLPAEMQWSLLAPTAFSTDGVSIGALLEPAYDVGGDAYDYSADGDVVHFALLDAMGHGLHASMISALAVGALRWARRSGLSLVEQAVEIDRVVADQLGGDGFVAGVLAALDRRHGELRWVTVAHEAPWLVTGDGARALPVRPCLPMGMRVGDERPEPVEQRAAVPRPSLLVLASDGIGGARDAAGVALGDAPVLDLAGDADRVEGNPAYRAARSVIRRVLHHAGGRLADDATVLVVASVPLADG